MTNATTNESPQSCYPEEVHTLREMLDEQRGILPMLRVTLAIAKCKQRIDALQTAIEALGGAL